MKLSLALSNRKGIALPMALLVITALTAALAAGFAGVAAEYTTNAAQRGQNRAYNLAQTGLSSSWSCAAKRVGVRTASTIPRSPIPNGRASRSPGAMPTSSP